MRANFTSDFFTGNRRRLQEMCATESPIVITANGLLQRGADSTYLFAQDANFWYLTGVDEPDVLLVIDSDQEYLIVPGRSASREAFDGAVDAGQLVKRSGVQTVYDDGAGWEKLTGSLEKVKRVAGLVVPQSYIEHYGMYTNPARAALIKRLQAVQSGLELEDVGGYLRRLRTVKQPQELQAIQAAIDITIASIQDVLQPAVIGTCQYEYELEAELAYGFRRRGAAGQAFDPIVASGKRACTLHNVANTARLEPEGLVIMDVGAEVSHYAADITRTVSLGEPTPRHRAVHAAVLAVQTYAIGLLKPGVLLKDYEREVEQFMGENLQELGLISTINHQKIRHYYPHATSHFLGLNVHDANDYELPLPAGAVVTVEPGIYIPEEGLGVRIEDDVVITEKGIKVLSDKLPRALG